MFKRLHHQHISQALNLLNSELLQDPSLGKHSIRNMEQSTRSLRWDSG